MNNSALLAPEWERIDLLGTSLAAARRGAGIPDEMGHRLGALQQEVQTLRRQPPWRIVVKECSLDQLDQDILACSLAPEAEPRLGWMYQELQPGITSTYPTPALIREMFVMGAEESAAFSQRLNVGSPLMKNGLIERHSADIYHPIHPSARACSGLLGWSKPGSFTLLGAVETPATGTWDDLVLPSHCIQSLREFMLWVTHRRQVVQEWQGRVTGGPVALFSGPSGTGKTFAAEVLANAFERPLFRVDLGLLVSKYIGETEKNLNALFDAAHGRDIVLLFDEADSLFGKRGEVKEARDRYANMEVSHLLSRIERHQGPCILTSNLREHLDPAFARRFQMVIEFPRPDAAARTELWRLHIPTGAPCDGDIDPVLLGNELSLTGGQIRNAALHGAFLAAGESSAINLTHVARAVWTELAKEGGEMMTANLGTLAQYLPEEAVDAAY
ncbi:MAG: ATP-binding protein [Gammaproteobacteria bacterium]|nr:ATP-binding protein [Gammaproteobacteria bacterium]